MSKQYLRHLLRLLLATGLAIVLAIPYAIGFVEGDFHHGRLLDLAYERYPNWTQFLMDFGWIGVIVSVMAAWKDLRWLVSKFSDWREARIFDKLEEGAPRDDVRARAAGLFRKASDGDAEAQYNVGLLYDSGLLYDDGLFYEDVECQIEIPRNYSAAAKWFQKAAEQGYAPAQTFLGLAFKFGRGMPQHEAQAEYWSHKSMAKYVEYVQLRKAAASGDETARQNLKVYAKRYGVSYNEGDGESQSSSEPRKQPEPLYPKRSMEPQEAEKATAEEAQVEASMREFRRTQQEELAKDLYNVVRHALMGTPTDAPVVQLAEVARRAAGAANLPLSQELRQSIIEEHIGRRSQQEAP